MNRLWKRPIAPPSGRPGWRRRALATLAVLLLFAGAAYLTVRALRAQDLHATAVATVAGGLLTRAELAIELRSLLWRSGQTWDDLAEPARNALRAAALDRLIDARLLARLAATGPARDLRRENDAAFELFVRQFPPPDEWKDRMELQGLGEAELRERLGREVAQRDAIERWLAARPDRVTEAEARAWFETHRGEFTIPERVRAAHIFLTRHDQDKPDRSAEIAELRRKIAGGETTFEALASTVSDDESAKRKGGDLGWFTRGRVPAEFADRVFALPVGELSPPVESHLGWHLLIVRERQPARPADFAEVREEVMAALESRWRETALRGLLTELRAGSNILLNRERIAATVPAS